jgi:hypothetical protein
MFINSCALSGCGLDRPQLFAKQRKIAITFTGFKAISQKKPATKAAGF